MTYMYLTGRIATCIEITLFRDKNQFTIENHSAILRSIRHDMASSRM